MLACAERARLSVLCLLLEASTLEETSLVMVVVRVEEASSVEEGAAVVERTLVVGAAEVLATPVPARANCKL
jgi:hypothetical protein